MAPSPPPRDGGDQAQDGGHGEEEQPSGFFSGSSPSVGGSRSRGGLAAAAVRAGGQQTVALHRLRERAERAAVEPVLRSGKGHEGDAAGVPLLHDPAGAQHLVEPPLVRAQGRPACRPPGRLQPRQLQRQRLS